MPLKGVHCLCVYVAGRGRGKEGMTSPPTCLWPFIKPGGGGGVEEREGLTVTTTILLNKGEAHAARRLKQPPPSCAASERGAQHADGVRGVKVIHLQSHSRLDQQAW